MDATATSVPLPPAPQQPIANPGAARRTISIALIVASACALAIAGPSWVQAIFQSTQLKSPASIALLFGAWIFSAFWHESGHLLAALALGFALNGVKVGPLAAYRDADSWRFRIEPRNLLAASVSAFPKRGMAWRERMLAVIAAGPFMTLFAAVFSASLLCCPGITGHLATFLAFVAQLNSLLFLLGLLPNGPGARVRNDATLFLTLWRNSSAAEEILRYHLLLQLQSAGFRPRFYPGHLVKEFARACERPEFAVVFANAIRECAMDSRLVMLAEVWDEYLTEIAVSCTTPWRDWAFAQSAFWDIVHRQNYGSARTKLAKVSVEVLRPEWLRNRTSAISCFLRRDLPRGFDHLRAAESSFRRRTPYAEFQIELMHRLRTCARQLSEFGMVSGRT